MNMPHLDIDGRQVGPGQPCFVIAEIGVNHDGRLDRALRLVEAAWEAGADAVKLQLFRTDRLLHPSSRLAAYQEAGGATDPAAMLRQYELDDTATERIVSTIRATGMVPLATPFSTEDVQQIARLGLPAVKLASPDLINPLLLDAAAELGVPMLLSTGAATPEEVAWTVRRLHERRAAFALLHCVSAYPTPPEAAHIGWVRDIAAHHGVVAGYSDHTQLLDSGAVAVAAGACIVEKHLTHDRNAPGPDHSASADPRQFVEYVRRLRTAGQLLGQGHKHLQSHEQDVRQVSRQSLVARMPIRVGETIAREHLTCQRPGTGIPVQQLDYIIGLKAARDVPVGALLDWIDLDRPAGTVPQAA